MKIFRRPTKEEYAEMAKRFTFRVDLDDEQLEDMDSSRLSGKLLAESMMHSAPRCRELSLALTRLEEAVMWANKAIVRRNENGEPLE